MSEQPIEFRELIYDREPAGIICKRYPQAVIVDASDYIHVGRFECHIPGVTAEDFYPFAIKEGFAFLCLGFQLLLMGKDGKGQEQCRKWKEEADA